jgi:hypothetical protein
MITGAIAMPGDPFAVMKDGVIYKDPVSTDHRV